MWILILRKREVNVSYKIPENYPNTSGMRPLSPSEYSFDDAIAWQWDNYPGHPVYRSNVSIPDRLDVATTKKSWSKKVYPPWRDVERG